MQSIPAGLDKRLFFWSLESVSMIVKVINATACF
jgi:hypothetical protein